MSYGGVMKPCLTDIEYLENYVASLLLNPFKDGAEAGAFTVAPHAQ